MVSTIKINKKFFSQMVYACLSLYRWGDRVRSQAGLGLAGVLLVSITIAAGELKQFYFPPTEVSVILLFSFMPLFFVDKYIKIYWPLNYDN
jgi:hypothetical protein